MYARLPKFVPCHPLSLYRVARFRKRLVAFIIDGFILALVNAFLQALLKIMLPLVPSLFLDNIEAFFTAFVIASNLFYFFIYTYLRGATPGKKIMQLKIVSTQNEYNPSLTQALLRTLGYVISFFSLGIGFFASLWSENKQCWHDTLSETAVVNLAREKSSLQHKGLVKELRAIEKSIFYHESCPAECDS